MLPDVFLKKVKLKSDAFLCIHSNFEDLYVFDWFFTDQLQWAGVDMSLKFLEDIEKYIDEDIFVGLVAEHLARQIKKDDFKDFKRTFQIGAKRDDQGNIAGDFYLHPENMTTNQRFNVYADNTPILAIPSHKDPEKRKFFEEAWIIAFSK